MTAAFMCGIAGFSLSPDSPVDRTLAAQALLAGIAERGADAVGYAHRGRRRRARDEAARRRERPPRRARTSRATTRRRSSTSATSRRAIPRSQAEQPPDPARQRRRHPQRRDRERRRRSSRRYGIERAEPEMTVDSEAIFALMAAPPTRRASALRAARHDGGRVARRARRHDALPRARTPSSALDRPDADEPLLRFHAPRTRHRRRRADRSGSDVHEVREGRLLHVVDGRDRRGTPLPARSPVPRDRLPPAGPSATRGRVVPRAPRRARRQPRLAIRRRTSTPSLEALAHEVLERRPGAARDVEQPVHLPLGQERRDRLVGASAQSAIFGQATE